MTTNKNNKIKRYRNFLDYHIEKLHDPKEAELYLEVSIEEYAKDGDTEAFLLALKDVAQAQGGLGKLAKSANLNRQNLYKSLSKEGNPKLKTVGAILHELGFRLSVEPISTNKSITT